MLQSQIVPLYQAQELPDLIGICVTGYLLEVNQLRQYLRAG
ncbi:MAG: hypothetical protein ABSD48_17870 [Armatimonadota bacterium]